MNKPISSLFVFSVVYCVVFRQKLKKTRRKHKRKQKETEKENLKTQRKTFILKRKTKIQDIQPSTRPRINISQVPAGRFLCFLFFCCSLSFYVFVCFYVFVLLCVCYVVLLCFRLVFLSFCLNTTQYTTLNTNKFEMCLFMTCVKCSKQCSSSFQITLLSLQISKSFVLYKTNSKRCISPRREPLFSLECASRLGESPLFA